MACEGNPTHAIFQTDDLYNLHYKGLGMCFGGTILLQGHPFIGAPLHYLHRHSSLRLHQMAQTDESATSPRPDPSYKSTFEHK